MAPSPAELRERLQSHDKEEISDALIDIGKGYVESLADDVVPFLKHGSEALHSAAISVLGFYWRLEKYRDTARAMMEHDADNEVRADALMAWSSYFRFDRRSRRHDRTARSSARPIATQAGTKRPRTEAFWR